MKIIDDDGNVIAEGQVLSLEPGDILVFQTKRRLDMATAARIRDELGQVFPDNKTAILGPDDELSILRRQEAPA